MDAERNKPPLSPEAATLLALLQRHCRRRDAAMPDKWLAEEIGVSVREVIDLADELLRADWLVVAETSYPMGRWIVMSAEDVSAGIHYQQVLRGRAKLAFVRARHVRSATEATSMRLRTAPETGQMLLSLFSDAE